MSSAPRPPLHNCVIRATAWVVLGIGTGVLVALLRARAAVAEHGYASLGYERGSYLTYQAASVEGLRQGLRLGTYVGLAVLGLLLLARVLPGSGPSVAVVRLLRRPRGLPWALTALALFVLAGLRIVMSDRRLQLGPSDFLTALAVLGLGAAGAIVAALVAPRISESSDDPRPRARLGSALAAGFTALGVGWWVDRYLIEDGWGSFDLRAHLWVLGLALAVYLLVRRRVLRGLGRGLTWTWRALVAAALLLALVPAALVLMEPARARPTLTATRPWNVIVVGIDTLRADRTSLLAEWPDGRDTTPNLRKLAERGVNFRRAISQAPWTLPAFASILTGEYPHSHGAISLAGRVRPREELLAEVLREAGYQTQAVVSHLFVDARHGFDQGFDGFDEALATGSEQATSSPGVTNRAIEFLEQRDGERPFFLFAHYFDPHTEYLEREYDYSSGYKGWLKGQLRYENVLKVRHLFSQAEIDFLLDRYDEEIRFTDEHLGRLLQYLDDSGLARDTLVVVVADHGEEFGERGYYGHTTGLNDEQIHVPLLIVPPVSAGIDPAVVDRAVETRAVFATVLDLLDVDVAPQARALSLLKEPGQSEAAVHSIVWLPDAFKTSGKRFRLASLERGRWKLIRDLSRERTFLFDLEADPGETADLWGSAPAEAAGLAEQLDLWITGQVLVGGQIESGTIDAETLRKLKDLGYLGSEDPFEDPDDDTPKRE